MIHTKYVYVKAKGKPDYREEFNLGTVAPEDFDPTKTLPSFLWESQDKENMIYAWEIIRPENETEFNLLEEMGKIASTKVC